VPLEHIADISSRLIVNKAAMKMKHQRITRLIARPEAACGINPHFITMPR
jgi:ATP phosphoribosyltransferase